LAVADGFGDLLKGIISFQLQEKKPQITPFFKKSYYDIMKNRRRRLKIKGINSIAGQGWWRQVLQRGVGILK
jgi:hypothetical protein